MCCIVYGDRDTRKPVRKWSVEQVGLTVGRATDTNIRLGARLAILLLLNNHPCHEGLTDRRESHL